MVNRFYLLHIKGRAVAGSDVDGTTRTKSFTERRQNFLYSEITNRDGEGHAWNQAANQRPGV